MARNCFTSVSICYVQEKNPFSFFTFFFFKLFINIFALKMYSFLYANTNGFQTNIFQVFTFVKILNHSPAQDLSKKTAAFCVFCGLRYSSDNLLSFDKNALYFVRSLYMSPNGGGGYWVELEGLSQ